MSKQNKQLEMIKAVYEDGEATINGRDYQLLSVNHKKRLKIFAYFSSIRGDLEVGNLSFMGTDEWDAIATMIDKHVSYNGDIINNIPDHWDKYGEDYLIYATTMMGAFSYPFLKGSLTA